MSKPYATSLAFTTLLGLSACQGAAPDSSADDAAARQEHSTGRPI